MILTLPVSHLIDTDNFQSVPGIAALEYKRAQPRLTHKLPALYHSNLGIVQDSFMAWFAGAVTTLKGMDLRLLSFDCGPAARVVQTENQTYVVQGDPLSRDALLAIITERVAEMRSKIKTPLAMENLNYYPTSAYEHVCDPEFISEAVRAVDVGLVLDIGHAIVSAHNLDMEIGAYLTALPLNRVVEIHLSSPGLHDGQCRDLHNAPTRREYDLLESLLPRVPGDAHIAIEHYTSYEAIVRSYATLKRFLEEYTSSL